MRVSENVTQPNEGYRKLKSRQSSLKKHHTMNQTTSSIYIPRTAQQFIKPAIHLCTPQTKRVQISQFQLSLQNQHNHQTLYNSSHFQIQLGQLQINIHSSMMQAFKQDFVSFAKFFQPVSKLDHSNSSVVSSQKNPKSRQNISLNLQDNSNQLLIEEANLSKYSISNHESFSVINPNQVSKQTKPEANKQSESMNKQHEKKDSQNNQIPFDSFRKLQNLSVKQIKLQIGAKTQDFKDGLLNSKENVEMNEQSMKRNLFQKQNSSNELRENLKTEQSQERLRQLVNQLNSPTLQLSPDQKQFRRSFHVGKGDLSECKSEGVELSLISGQKTVVKKKRSALESVLQSVSNGKKVMVTNKLIFLREHA